MKASEFISKVSKTSALDIEEVDGALEAKVSIPSNMLPVPQPDTYHTFNGDGYTEQEIEYLREATGLEQLDDWHYLDVQWNGSDILAGLATACVEAIIDQQYTSDDVVRSIELTQAYRPNSYNFSTDSYDANWTLNLTALAEWVENNLGDETVEEIMLEKYKSRSGFLSYVPGYFSDEPEWAWTWGALHLYIERELDADAMFMYVAEQEFAIYEKAATWSWTPRALAAYNRANGLGEDQTEDELTERVENIFTQEQIDEAMWNVVSNYRG